MVKYIFLQSLSSLLVLLLSFSAFAKTETEEEILLKGADACKANLTNFANEVEAMLARFESNYSVRGFDNSHFPPTEENRDLAEKYGFLWWYTQGYFVPNEAAAYEHAKQFSRNISDQFSVGLYFIADESELGIAPSEDGELVPAENLQKIFSRGAIEIDYLGDDGKPLEKPKVRKIAGESLLGRMDLENQINPKMGVTYVKGHARSYNSNYININGWHTGKFRGIVDHVKFLQSPTYTRIVSAYQDLYGHGYRMMFDPVDPAIQDDAFDVLLKTPRKKRVFDLTLNKVVETDLPVSINRHLRVGVAHLRKPTAYLAPLLSPTGQVVGGEAGAKHNMEGESIFYAPDRNQDMPELTFASKISMAMIVELSLKQGLMYSSSGPMVSSYSAVMGTEVVPLREALKILESTTQDQSKLPSNYTWNPFVGVDYKPGLNQQFKDMNRLKEAGGLTRTKFLGTRPAINDVTIALGKTQNIVPAETFVQVVDSFKAAQEIAAKHPEREMNTVFIVAPGYIHSLQQRPASFLERLFANKLPSVESQKKRNVPVDAPIQLVFSFKKPGGRDLRYYEDGSLIPRLSLDGLPDISWGQANDETVMTVKGWAPAQ